MSEIVVTALITGTLGLISAVASAIIVARNATDKLLNELRVQQAVADEKVSSYQRITNDKIDDLRKQVSAQAEYGTRIALLEAEVARLKEGNV